MTNRKVALIACAQGQWVHIAGMKQLHLDARVADDAKLEVEILHADQTGLVLAFDGPGRHKLVSATWARVKITGGSIKDALCVLESREAA